MAGAQGSPGFGSTFTPHMLRQKFTNGAWEKSEIVPFGNLEFSPATAVFHYAQEIFEGFKAYRQPDNSCKLFRPDRNMRRMNNSAARLCLPAIDEKAVLNDIDTLVRTDKDSLPARPQSLYVRPCMIGVDPLIRVNPASNVLFFAIVSVVDDYFSGKDPRGVRLRTETEFVRAAPGGTGAAKCGGNYAASLAAQGRAAADGFDQVVWLDAKEHRFIEEMGGMNIMFVIDGALATPSIESGSILPGVTRESLLAMAKALGRKTEERAISTDELIQAQKDGRLQEAFACGTAAVITPIREIRHRGEILYENKGIQPGALTMQLRQALLDLQYGVAPDTFNWMHRVF